MCGYKIWLKESKPKKCTAYECYFVYMYIIRDYSVDIDCHVQRVARSSFQKEIVLTLHYDIHQKYEVQHLLFCAFKFWITNFAFIVTCSLTPLLSKLHGD